MFDELQPGEVARFCPFEDDGQGGGCLRPEGHPGAHLVIETSEEDE